VSAADTGARPQGRGKRGSSPATTDPLIGEALAGGRFSDPFAVLGPHRTAEGRVIRAFLPRATGVSVISRADGRPLGVLAPEGPDGLFSGQVENDAPYLLRIDWNGVVQETEDPYSFGLALGEMDLYLFSQGAHWRLAERLGASVAVLEGVCGVRFSVWAPNARRVSVIGDFNTWDGRRHPMRLRREAGVWEIFVPRLTAGERYKFEIVGSAGQVLQKADPLARQTEAPPRTASIVAAPPDYPWSDQEWIASRAQRQRPRAAIAIYEVHAASWLRPADDEHGVLSWDELAERLIPYATRMGFTHLELMPVMEHPFGGSWGYQPLFQFAPSARFGPPEGFARFVDRCHRAGLGVILDWVPGHFPTDPHGLAGFDGTALYEHADPREGFHHDWNTLIYNLGRREVQGFLLASALFWLETFHIDGLRVDAVASMLYRDYSRRPGEWTPNIHGGRENLEAIAFFRRLNTLVAERCPGAVTMAEESTAWPGVSAPVTQGGLGFFYKWNMGWMHDTLTYFGKDPIHRVWHHAAITFGLIYAFSERFVLPLSHDEVVYGKGSLFRRAPGDDWQKRANLRAYFGFMWTQPGKKLLFMGGEIGQPAEWNHDAEVDWGQLDDPGHAGIQRLVGDLNRLYVAEPSLHEGDAEPWGFEWVIVNDSTNSVFAWLRRDRAGAPILMVLNMTPIPRPAYRVGTPVGGAWTETLNSDAAVYGGANLGNGGKVSAEARPAHGQPFSVSLMLPPLAILVLKPNPA
jgi:1,4-alpha-glucan branching enzyme